MRRERGIKGLQKDVVSLHVHPSAPKHTCAHMDSDQSILYLALSNPPFSLYDSRVILLHCV